MDTKDKGILIVEDDDTAREMLFFMLSQGGFGKIYQAAGISECLSILSERDEEIYVVLLDLQLPDGYGLSLMEHLVNSHNCTVGIIVTTGYGDVESATRFFQLGTETIVAADFQQKPIDVNKLLDQVHRTANLIENKRKRQSILIQDQLWAKLESINTKLSELDHKLMLLGRIGPIEDKLAKLEKNSPSFLKELGMDLLRLVIIGLAVIAFLYLDIGGVISKIIERAR